MMKNLTTVIGKPLTPPKAFFEWCYSQIPTYQWENKKEVLLASPRKKCPLIKKRLTKQSRLSFPTKFYSFALVLVSKKRIEIQSHDYWQTIENGKETIRYELANFERFANNEHLKAHKWLGEWEEGLLRNYGFMSGAYTNTIFYPNQWQEQLPKNKDLKYLTIPTVDRYNLPILYRYRNEIEFLQKIGATTLANEIAMGEEYTTYLSQYDKKVDMRVITRNWLQKKKARLKNSVRSFNELMLETHLKQRHGKPIEGIERKLHYKDVKQLPPTINVMKFQKWWLNQQTTFRYYLDYLNLLDELHVPMTSDTLLFPTELQAKHDEAVETLNQLKRELNEQAYRERAKEVKKLEQEIGDLVFLTPNNLEDIVNEGNALHHCVGGRLYLEQHSNGQTTIVFIHRKDQQDSPISRWNTATNRWYKSKGNTIGKPFPQKCPKPLKSGNKSLKPLNKNSVKESNSPQASCPY